MVEVEASEAISGQIHVGHCGLEGRARQEGIGLIVRFWINIGKDDYFSFCWREEEEEEDEDVEKKASSVMTRSMAE